MPDRSPPNFSPKTTAQQLLYEQNLVPVMISVSSQMKFPLNLRNNLLNYLAINCVTDNEQDTVAQIWIADTIPIQQRMLGGFWMTTSLKYGNAKAAFADILAFGSYVSIFWNKTEHHIKTHVLLWNKTDIIWKYHREKLLTNSPKSIAEWATQKMILVCVYSIWGCSGHFIRKNKSHKYRGPSLWQNLLYWDYI